MSASETGSSSEGPHAPLGRALALMIDALRLLDQAEAPADIGAHLDLAICRLSEALDRPWPASNSHPGD